MYYFLTKNAGNISRNGRANHFTRQVRTRNTKQRTQERDGEMQFDMLNMCVCCLLIFIEKRRDVGIYKYSCIHIQVCVYVL